MGRYSQAAAAVGGNEAQEPERGRFCAATGCPLGGSMRAGGAWYCGHHLAAKPIEWQAITAEIIAGKRDGRLNDRGDEPRRGPTQAVAELRARLVRRTHTEGA
jgi:hypothetical protein